MTHLNEPAETVALLDGRYQLHERVGEGGMAQVYRAEDTILGRTVAIKLLKDDAEVLAAPVRAHREVGALARLNHPSLVTLLEANLAADGSRYLVMEYVDGPTLSRLLRDGPLSTSEVTQLAGQLASGLGAVHAAGLVHRDVKPSNILLPPALLPEVSFAVKLADFGLAQLADATSVTTPGMVLGTAAYLAPEQVRGEGSCPASDIYSLGLVLLEALTGKRAFSHTSGIGEVIVRLVESPAIPAHIDPLWADLLTRMTLTDPAARPTALEVADVVPSLPTSTARPTKTAVFPQLVFPQLESSDIAPARARSLSSRPLPVAHRRRRRPAARVWVGAGVAASVITAVLVCLPAFATDPSNPPPAAPASVDRLTDDASQAPVVAPVSVDSPSQTHANVPERDVQPASRAEAKAAREAAKQAQEARREAQ